MRELLQIVLSCAVVAWCAPASAAILAQYNFETPSTVNSAGTGETNDAGAVSGISVSTLDRAIASTFFIKRDSTSSTRVVSGSVDNHTWSIAGDIPTATYTVGTTNFLSFTLTPDLLTNLDLTQLSLRMGIGKTSGSGGHNLDVFVHTSLDGFAAPVGAAMSIAGLTSTNTGDGPIWATNTLNLSSLGTLTAPVTFRLYFTDGSGLSSKHGLLDTLSIEGTVTPVPEPGTWAALSGILLLGGWTTIRRRGKSPL